MTRPLSGLMAGALLALSASAITFTGDVDTDFAPWVYGLESIMDPVGDVGLPANAPEGTVSGWDISRVMLLLSEEDDALHVGVEFAGIAGDADGDGLDGSTSDWLAANGGIDAPHLLGVESICVLIDFDQDGSFDLFAGVPAFSGSFIVAEAYNPFIPLPPSFWVGDELPQHAGPVFYSPTSEAPDFEFSLTNMSDLLWSRSMEVLFYSGSSIDDGIGEDNLHAVGYFSSDPGKPITPVVSISYEPDSIILDWDEIYENTDGDPIIIDAYPVFRYDPVSNQSTLIGETPTPPYNIYPVPMGSYLYFITARPLACP